MGGAQDCKEDDCPGEAGRRLIELDDSNNAVKYMVGAGLVLASSSRCTTLRRKRFGRVPRQHNRSWRKSRPFPVVKRRTSPHDTSGRRESEVFPFVFNYMFYLFPE